MNKNTYDNNRNNKNNNKNNTTGNSLQEARLARHLAFQRYTSSNATGQHTADPQINEITAILNELEGCATDTANALFATENVIALQLSDSIEEFAATLSSQNRKIFMKRYFYMESTAAIASLYKMSEDKVADTLRDCLGQLKALLSAKGYIYKKETLFEGFTNISDSLLAGRASSASAQDSKQAKTFLIISTVFAFVVCIAIMAIILSALFKSGNSDDILPDDASTDATDIVDWSTLPLDVLAERYFFKDGCVDIDQLLNYLPEYPDYTAKPTTQIKYSDAIYTYEQYELKDNSILQYLIGPSYHEMGYDSIFSEVREYDDTTSDWYRLLGHSDNQYLVQEADGYYTLWEFEYISCDETNKLDYGRSMDYLYAIYDANKIKEIMVTKVTTDEDTEDTQPTSMTIKNADNISYIYYVMSIMSCYGNGQWELISGYPEHNFEDVIADAVMLEIITTDGRSIGDYYYSDLAGCFFENVNGIAYSKVSDNASAKLKEIFYSESAYEESSYSTVLATHGIYSAADISSISVSTMVDEYGTEIFDMTSDPEELARIFEILSNMTGTDSIESDELYGAMVYEIEIFDSNGSGIISLVFYGTYGCIVSDDVYYPLNESDCSFLNSLGIKYLTVEQNN